MDVILSIKNINKSFPGVKALDDVSIDFEKGRVHALVGENGAGKSTIINILAGSFRQDSGTIVLRGAEVAFSSPIESNLGGIGVVHQEINLVPELSVAENIFLGRLKTRKSGRIDWKDIEAAAAQKLSEFGLNINPKTLVSQLSVAEMQMVEIAKVVSLDVEIIIMDEPTATLTSKDTQQLFNMIRQLKEANKTILYVSHRMEEIFEICDDITILRDGRVIDTARIADITKDEIIEKMVGRKIEMEYPRRDFEPGETVLEVRGLSRENVLHDISFSLRKGEVLGFVGLIGAGRSEMARALFGYDKKDSGEIMINGDAVRIDDTQKGIKNGLALLPEDRKVQGLVLESSIKNNITLPKLEKVIKGAFIDKKKETKISKDLISLLKIVTPSEKQKTLFLSGGNQQKVVVAKWLYSDSNILILDEPTRGIDVGAKREIYELINKLAGEGKSVILISSDLPEVMGMSDRMLVMRKGAIVAEFNREDATQDAVIKYALG